MFRKIYNLIRNNIAKTKIFWRFRHIIQPDVWTSYKNDSVNIRREFYSEFLTKHSLKSIFEFGCASGPNFFSIKKHANEIYFFGYDISKKAIKFVKNDNQNQRYFFTHKLKEIEIINYLKINNLKTFDLAIFDRVLYMISEAKIKLFFRKYSDYFKYIIIDDFHAKKPEWDKEKYIFSKNYETILNDFNYKLIETKDSELPSSTAKKYAKRLIFKKEMT